MMRPCLIDTSSWIEAFRTDGARMVRDRVAQALSEGRARLTEIVLLELWNGARGDRERGDLSRIESGVPLLPTTPEVWQLANELARRCRAKGVTAPSTDLLVFACARHHAAELDATDSRFDLIRRAEGEGGAE